MQKLTERNLPGLKKGEYRDPQLPGFLVRVTPTRRHFEIRYSLRSRQFRLNIGNAQLAPLADAREDARQLLAGVARGEDPRAHRGRHSKPAAEITIDRLGEQYFAWAEATSAGRPRVLVERRRLWAQMIAPDLGKLPVRALTRPRIRAWGEAHAARAGVSANRAFGLLRAVHSWALRRDLIDATPFVALDRPFTGERRRERALSIDKLRALLQALEDLPFGLSEAMRLLLLTGVRRSNVTRATWAEFDGATWRIPAARMKANRPHTVPVSRQALEALERQRERVAGDPRLFPGITSSGQISDAYLGRLRRRIARRLGRTPERWTVHDLRRTVAVHLADMLGVRLEVIAAILAHAIGSEQTRIYSLGELMQERRDALQRWADWLDTLHPIAPAAETVDTAGAARLTGLSVHTIEDYRHLRRGPASALVAGRVVYRREDVTAWMAAKQALLAQRLPRSRKARVSDLAETA